MSSVVFSCAALHCSKLLIYIVKGKFQCSPFRLSVTHQNVKEVTLQLSSLTIILVWKSNIHIWYRISEKDTNGLENIGKIGEILVAATWLSSWYTHIKTRVEVTPEVELFQYGWQNLDQNWLKLANWLRRLIPVVPFSLIRNHICPANCQSVCHSP